MATKREWRTIGEVRVDSDIIVICDPCQADEASDWCADDGFVDSTQNDNAGAELKNDKGFPIAVAMHTGVGDGQYCVEARYETHLVLGKRCAEIRIRFLPHPQFGDMDELAEMMVSSLKRGD
jgi:hypothetical protein